MFQNGEPAPSVVVVLPQVEILPDGSTVELRSGATIAVDFAGPFRRVTLQRGEAHFQVAKDPTRPFIVTAGGVDVRAVGTAFLVDVARPETVDVIVTEGRVAVVRASAVEDMQDLSPATPVVLPESTLVDAGRRLVVNREPSSERLEVSVVAPEELDARLSWRSTRLEFTRTRLADAVKLFNQHSKIEIVIDDPELAELFVNGRFRADNTDALVRLLEANFGIRAQRDSSRIILRSAR